MINHFNFICTKLSHLDTERILLASRTGASLTIHKWAGDYRDRDPTMKKFPGTGLVRSRVPKKVSPWSLVKSFEHYITTPHYQQTSVGKNAVLSMNSQSVKLCNSRSMVILFFFQKQLVDKDIYIYRLAVSW